ncbi:MAG: hypothetical protein ACRCS3_08065 [Paracoccaceae bacterium]
MFTFITASVGYFRAGPRTHLILACVFCLLGGMIMLFGDFVNADIRAARNAPQPAAVSLTDFTGEDVHAASEVHVIAQINTDYNYRLIEEGRGANGTRFMYVLFGPEDAVDSKVVRAAVVLSEAEIDPFLAMIGAALVDPTEIHGAFRLNGAVTTTLSHEKLAYQAFAREGLTMAPDFVFIEPWLEGRQAALVPLDDAVTRLIAGVIAAPAVLSLLLAAIGWRFGYQGPVKRPVKRAISPQVVRAQIAASMQQEPPLTWAERLKFAVRNSPTFTVIIPVLVLLAAIKPSYAPLAVVVLIMAGTRFGIGRVKSFVIMAADTVIDFVADRMPKRKSEVQTMSVAGARPVVTAPQMDPAIRPGFSWKGLLSRKA